MPHGAQRDLLQLEGNNVVCGGAPCRCIQNSSLREGRLRAITFRTTAYLKGKPIQGQQPAVKAETNRREVDLSSASSLCMVRLGVSNPSSRVMVTTSVIPSLQ